VGKWVSFAEIKSRVGLEQVLRAYQVEGLRRSGGDQYRAAVRFTRGGARGVPCESGAERVSLLRLWGGRERAGFRGGDGGCSVREAALRLQENGLAGAPPVAEGPPPWRPVAARGAKLVTKKREGNPPLGFSLVVDGTHPYLGRRGMDRTTADHFGVGWFGEWTDEPPDRDSDPG